MGCFLIIGSLSTLVLPNSLHDDAEVKCAYLFDVERLRWCHAAAALLAVFGVTILPYEFTCNSRQDFPKSTLGDGQPLHDMYKAVLLHQAGQGRVGTSRAQPPCDKCAFVMSMNVK